MAISSILRRISYSFNTNFLLVNFAFVGKKTPKKPPPWICHCGSHHRPNLQNPLGSPSPIRREECRGEGNTERTTAPLICCYPLTNCPWLSENG